MPGSITKSTTARDINSLVRLDRERIERLRPDIAFDADPVPYCGWSIAALKQDLGFSVRLDVSKLRIAREKLRDSQLVPWKAHEAVQEAVELRQYQKRISAPRLRRAKET